MTVISKLYLLANVLLYFFFVSITSSPVHFLFWATSCIITAVFTIYIQFSVSLRGPTGILYVISFFIVIISIFVIVNSVVVVVVIITSPFFHNHLLSVSQPSNYSHFCPSLSSYFCVHICNAEQRSKKTKHQQQQRLFINLKIKSFNEKTLCTSPSQPFPSASPSPSSLC